MGLRTERIGSARRLGQSKKTKPQSRTAPLFEQLEGRQLLSATQVNLSSSFNRVGIIKDGTTSSAFGFDNNSDFYSGTKLGTSVTFNGNAFKIGPSNAKDVVFGSGQKITLNAGKFASLSFLAAAAPGAQKNLTFKITYTDNTTQSFTRSISDWIDSSKFANESIAKTIAYPVDGFDGKPTGLNSPPHVYGYTLALNSSKTVKSITLPNNGKVGVFAMDLVPKAPAFTQVSLGSVFNRIAAIKDGTSSDGIGFDSHNDFYSGTLLGTSLTLNGNKFTIAASGVKDAVMANNQKITLPSGKFKTLTFLAAAANGGQKNQSFKVIYTDNTTQSFTRSISDWVVPSSFANESIAKTMNYPVDGSGEKLNGKTHLYAYTLTLNSAKTVRSFNLGNNLDVGVFAVGLNA